MNPTQYPRRLMVALALLMLTIFLSASVDSDSGAAWAQAGDVMAVKLDGQEWTANRITSSLGSGGESGFYGLTLSAYRDAARTELIRLWLRLPDDDKYERTYTLTRWCTALSGGLSLDTRADNIDEVRHALSSGEMTITSFDRRARTVSGTFSGTVKNYTGTRTITLTDGRFAVVVPPIEIIINPRWSVKPCRPG